jgi:hypothetical protein
MPKVEIDYSNTTIYKIICKDQNIKDVYVGHTTSFAQRKHAHKQNCINSKAKHYNCKVYEVIRANGGWSNWSMEIINFFNCADHYAARIKEHEYVLLLNANLNSIDPLPKPKQKVVTTENIVLHLLAKTNYDCVQCNIHCASNKLLEEHNQTQKHLRKVKKTENNVTESPPKLTCELCDYSCGKPSDMAKHFASQKHQRNKCTHESINDESINDESINDEPINNESINNESINDEPINNESINNEPINNELMKQIFTEHKDFKHLLFEMMKSNNELQKQNNELQKKVLDVCTNNTIINHTNNSHNNNKTFNLMFFLNEQCKDAMNLSDFMNSFELGLEDLESIGELGYVEGITKIMVDRLNAMDIYKRPVHCSDAKRETLYVKNDDKWEKEARHNPKLRYAIKTASFQSMKLTVLWSDTYPESKSSESRLNDKYMKLVFNSTGGHGEIADSEDKIIRRILKEIVIDKS